MRLAISTINPTVGDIDGNAAQIKVAIQRARSDNADLLVLPELCLCGYPPKDLLWQEGFVQVCMDACADLAAAATGLTVVLGTPWRHDGGELACNSLVAVRDGEVLARYDKRLLPTYDVFDEDRYFTPGEKPVVLDVAGVPVGLAICEDLWRGDDAGFSARYRGRPDPVDELVEAGARLILSPSASPFVLDKASTQRRILQDHVKKHNIALVSVNQFGANDELIFDGHTLCFAPDPSSASGARLITANQPFERTQVLVDIPPDKWSALPPDVEAPLLALSDGEALWRALTLGVRDYCRKTGFTDLLLGLSGGIDSAVTACIAAAALGAEHVLAIGMPSRYSSEGSVADARELAEAIGVRFITKPIESLHDAAGAALSDLFIAMGLGEQGLAGITDENVQSRIRGMILMAVSNKTGALLLATGNKSEIAVGYCTLYGDMNGGLAVLSDVDKARVYELARHINQRHDACGFARPPIPESTIVKPPSAELKPDQTDQDTLPPYDVLDEIVRRYVEARQSPQRIARESGFPRETVAKAVRLIDVNEYKRKQLAIGLKVTSVAFGSGRRRPIAQGWRPETDLESS